MSKALNVFCDFCGDVAEDNDDKTFMVGNEFHKMGLEVCICSDCVRLCLDVIEGRREKRDKKSGK